MSPAAGTCPTCGTARPSLPEILRQEILAALDADDMTQAELARRIGRSEKHVSQVLTGRCGLSLPLAEQMLAACGRRFVVRTEPTADL